MCGQRQWIPVMTISTWRVSNGLLFLRMRCATISHLYIYLYVNVGGSTLSYPIRHQQWCMIYLCLVVVDTVNTYMYLFVQLKSCYRPMNRHTSLMSFNTHMGPMWGLLNLAPKFPMLRLLCRKERYLYYANGQFVRQACKAFMPFRKGLYTASKQLDWLSNHSAWWDHFNLYTWKQTKQFRNWMTSS